uniref:Uncharacterized protein n=1 Tax=Oryza brachyantha TaxID=4533 RepID=J3NDP5_ORYBR
MNRLTLLARKGGCGALSPSLAEALFASSLATSCSQNTTTVSHRGRTLLTTISIPSLSGYMIDHHIVFPFLFKL